MPNARSASSARRRPRGGATRAWSPRSTDRARARCARGRAVRARRRAARRSRAAVRRSCQTIARCSGRPVARSQTTVVSRWLVMPIARDRLARRAADARGDLGRASRASRPRSPPRRARPSRAPGSAGGTRGTRCAGPTVLVDRERADAGGAGVDARTTATGQAGVTAAGDVAAERAGGRDRTRGRACGPSAGVRGAAASGTPARLRSSRNPERSCSSATPSGASRSRFRWCLVRGRSSTRRSVSTSS